MRFISYFSCCCLFSEYRISKNHIFILFLYNLAWLRRNCMAVFHYVASVLENVPLFDTESSAAAAAPNTTNAVSEEGSIYNDFDHSPLDLLHRDQSIFCFSQTTNVVQVEDKINEEEQETLADVTYVAKGARDIRISCESPYYDNSSDTCDVAYREKVYSLLTNREMCWEELEISIIAEESFKRRLHRNCELPDTVYDTWLLKMGYARDWFDYHNFHIEYPDADSHITEQVADEATSCQEPSQEETMNSREEKSDRDLEALPSFQPTKQVPSELTRVGKKKKKRKKKKKKTDAEQIGVEKIKRRRMESSSEDGTIFEPCKIVSSTPVKELTT